MALVALTPWPTTPAAVTAAVACLQAAILGAPDSQLPGLGATAAAMVERFAPDAPTPVKNEAVIRISGYLYAKRPEKYGKISVGSLALESRPERMHADAMRNSGARSILSPWRNRRALPLEAVS